MKRLLLVPVLGVAALAVPSTVHAQLGGWPDSARPAYAEDGRQSYYESRRGAYDNGYREGVKQGEQDGRKRDSRGYQNERTWQRADKGYNRSYGDLDRYRQQFRAGYAAGYQDGYGRYAPYGNGRYGNGRAVPRQPYPNQYPGGYGYPGQRYPDPYGYPSQGSYPYGYPGQGGYGRYSAAYPNGVNDGLEKGREDARKHRSYDPLRHSWYRGGDHDYRSEYGPKDQYRNVYRQGFKEGYDRGYREGNYGYYGR